MRTPSLLVAAALCGLALTAFVQPAPQEEDETPLMTEMNRISDALRGLRRSVRDPEQNADSLAALVVCQEASLKCKVLPPAMLGSVPADKQAEFLKAYRLEMIAFETKLLEFEAAILQGASVDALKEMYNELKGLEDPAHERFTEGG